ncbi:MAG: GerAB/ArcD/ProY family transporter [Clostridia bacterium]|nr:GerAB/ArcD/ProY family transporter [Clostridia bacterium]
MQSKAAIRGRQLIFLMLISRLGFSTVAIAAINPGNDIQDMLLAVPVIFVINLLIVIPVIMLLKRHPGRDLVDCSMQICGKACGSVIGIFYFLCFTGLASLLLNIYQNYYSSSIIEETPDIAIAIPLLLVAVYGAIRGIESISRFGLLVFASYVVVSAIIYLSLLPDVNLNYLQPMFYNGSRVFTCAIAAGVNLSYQVLLLAMCTPFLKKDTNITRVFVIWDAVAMLIYLLTDFYVVTVLGPSGGRQIFPLETLVTISHVGPFERLDAVFMIAWILNSVLSMTGYLFFASQCLVRIGLQKWRRTLLFVIGIIVIVCTSFYSSQYVKNIGFYISPIFTAAIVIVIFLLPLGVLVIDIVKGKVAQSNEKVV